jgi:hypothetical protein
VTVTGVSEATKKRGWAEAQPSKGGDGRAKKGKKENSEGRKGNRRKKKVAKEDGGGVRREKGREKKKGKEKEKEGGEGKRKGKGRKRRRKERGGKKKERVVGARDPLKYCGGTARRRSRVRYRLEGPQRRRFPRRRHTRWIPVAQ